MRVLVVDDDCDSVDAIAMLLALEGHSVRIAHDGIDAISEAVNYHPDVVVLDVLLPSLNGYGVARELRRLFDGRLRIVGLTGWGRSSDVAEARESGFDEVLVKPSTSRQILDAISGVP